FGKSKDDGSLILLRRGVLDTRSGRHPDSSADDVRRAIDAKSARAGDPASLAGRQLRIIQFAGPIRRDWIDRLTATGSTIVGYIPNYAYMIRGGAAELGRVAAMDGGLNADDARPLSWIGKLNPSWKIDPIYDDDLLDRAKSSGALSDHTAELETPAVNVEGELLDVPETAGATSSIYAQPSSVVRSERRFRNFIVLSVVTKADRLIGIAGFEEVLFIGPGRFASLHDERSDQIVAANLAASGTQPSGPGYLAWLHSKGLDVPSGFLIDVADTGLDK